MCGPRHNTSNRPWLEPGGFSLIELILVLTIISVLAAIAVPRYAGALARYRADAAARRIITDLDYARQRARAQSSAQAVEVQPDADTIHLSGVPNPNDPSDGDWLTRMDQRPYYADLTAVNFGGDTTVSFDGYGYPDSDGTVTLKVGTETRIVALNADTGKAAIQ